MDIRNLRLVGLLTWLIVGVPSILWEAEHHGLLSLKGIVWLLSYAAFIVLFFVGTRDVAKESMRLTCTLGQTIAALTCLFIQPGSIAAILLVMIAGQLAGVTIVTALLWIVAQTTVFWILEAHRADALWVVLAYFTFELFALFSIRIAHQESEARLALAAANAELQVATGLLDIGSRTEERLRIARDLHDLLGHHLTALSLNLEVASHLADGEAREHVTKSQAIAKQLLSDVRDVVSRLRNNEPVDLASAVNALRNVIDRPALTVEMNQELSVADPAVAQVALRAIQEIVTNSVRHSGARNLWLKLTAEDHALAIAARDDGTGTDRVAFGNGLRGMRERVEQLRGTMDVSSMRGQGFEVNVRIPLVSA